ncbi:ferric reduction oxidase 7, chloroplastic-like protein [Tanacetum coccineum]|uniref:Ferric reduction oxidase 7, chloroplastic-like protein n=1 Tax=Tanacetum coccineum TaxID=301880 RepID=A0ABQ5DXD0_9ASTR
MALRSIKKKRPSTFHTEYVSFKILPESLTVFSRSENPIPLLAKFVKNPKQSYRRDDVKASTVQLEEGHPAIVLPEQSLASKKAGLAVSKKGLTLKELLQQTSHHNSKVRRALRYNGLRWVSLQVRELSWLQRHTFSISSSPLDGKYHVAVLIKVDLKYENLILVAGGIGISPFLAVLTDILNRIKESKPCMPRNVLIIWAVKISEKLPLLYSLDLNSLFPDFYTKLNLKIPHYFPQDGEDMSKQATIFYRSSVNLYANPEAMFFTVTLTAFGVGCKSWALWG